MDPRLKAYQRQSRSSTSAPAPTAPAPAAPVVEPLVKTVQPTEAVSEKSLRKVAKFLILLGQDEAARVVRHLDPGQIEALGQEIADIKTIEPVEAEAILREFGYLTTRRTEQVSGGTGVAQDILNRAFGEQKGQSILKKAVPAPVERPFSYLNDLDRAVLIALLGKESVTVLTLVVPFLDKPQSAALLKHLDPQLRLSLIKRLAALEAVPSAVVAQVDQAMKERLHSLQPTVTEAVDGKAKLAEILRHMNLDHEASLLKSLSEVQPELTEDLRRRLFTQDDILRVSDEGIEELLRSKTDPQLGLLYLSAPEALRQKLEANLSKRRWLLVQAEADLQADAPPRERQDVLRGFVDEVRAKVHDGELVLISEDDEYL